MYPWGAAWSPPEHAGNYWSEELRPLMAAGKHSSIKGELPGYRDGYAETAPVGSYAVNRFGLHDLGGNAREWCEDWYEKEQTSRVLRGASWGSVVRGHLLSSYRFRYAPASRLHYCGFRGVAAGSSSAR